ncbi:MAG: glycosyltransferase family 4 protein [Minisyncoccia bacterium]
MSVLHIIPTYTTGGLGAVCLSMIRAWPEKAQHVAIAPRWHSYPNKYELLSAFAQTIGGLAQELDRNFGMTPPAWGQVLGTHLKKLWRGQHPTHVIQYNVLDIIPTLYALQFAQYKGRVLAHVGTILPDAKTTRGIFTSPMIKNVKFIPVHEAVGTGLIELGTPPDQVTHAVWNGGNLDRFDAPFRQQALVFGFAARMSVPTQKNWPLLIEAFAQAAIPGSKLRLAGDGADEKNLRKKVAECGVIDSVEFCGNVSPQKMPEFMQSLDVFVMSSLPIEGFANVISEAAGARCMMLGTDVPGVRLPFGRAGGASFLAVDAGKMAHEMRELHSSALTRLANQEFVERLRPMLDAKTMAQEYFNIGVAP